MAALFKMSHPAVQDWPPLPFKVDHGTASFGNHQNHEAVWLDFDSATAH